MTQSIVRSLEKRQINNRLSPENFVKVNYFNESMLKRFKVEHKIELEFKTSDDLVHNGSWNCDGTLLGCGKVGRGVEIYKPFKTDKKLTTIPVCQNHYLTDVLFMPNNNNLMTVSSRNKSNFFFWNTSPNIVIDSYIKVWDISKNIITRTYGFKGPFTKTATSTALPNQIWFNTDNRTQAIAEADIRSPLYKTIRLGPVQCDSLVYRRCFDVHPVDGVTIAVGDRNKLLFYDRRTMTSQRVARPSQSFDFSTLIKENSYIIQVKYDPCGRSIILTNSLTQDHYVLSLSNPSLDEMKLFSHKDSSAFSSRTRNLSFLGDKHVLFDKNFRNYAVVFDLETAKFVGKIEVSHQSNIFSNTYSMPHPTYCMIAATNHKVINFVSPTSLSCEYLE